MAKLERRVTGDFNAIMRKINDAVLNGSMSASYEDGSSYSEDGFRCEVRVYERYSALGGNRVSMTVTLAGRDGSYLLSAITSGGSQAMFLKMNTMGEKAFLENIERAIFSL